MSDLDAAVAYAATDHGLSTPTGWQSPGSVGAAASPGCICADNPKVKAGVAWYGRLVGQSPDPPLHPKHPTELAGELKAPVLGLYGGADTGIPLDTIEGIGQVLRPPRRQAV